MNDLRDFGARIRRAFAALAQAFQRLADILARTLQSLVAFIVSSGLVTVRLGPSGVSGPMPIPSWLYATRRARRRFLRSRPKRDRPATALALLRLRFKEALRAP